MNFFTITSVSNYLNSRRIKSFHANMFHGRAERDGREYPHDPKVWANTESPSNLQISRTGRKVPVICNPSSHLVVAERLARTLERVPNIRLLPVVFKRLVDVDYEKGDMTWGEKWGNIDPRELLRMLPNVPAFHETIGRYYEVLTWRLNDVEEHYASKTELTLETGTPPIVERITVHVSERMLTDYPMLAEYGEILVNEDIFRIVDDDLDRDYFIVCKYELS